MILIASGSELILAVQAHERLQVEGIRSRVVGTSGHVIGMKTFGASAPLKELQKRFGFEPDQVAEAAREQVRRRDNHAALMR